MSVVCTLCALHIGVIVRIAAVPKVPLQPYDTAKWDSPCSNLTVATCVGGFPSIAAALRHGAAGADGVLRIGGFAHIDGLVQGHPAGLALNDVIWPRAAVEVLHLQSPDFLMWIDRVHTARLLAEQQWPVISTNLLLHQNRIFAHALKPYYITEPYPGIRIGVLVLFPHDFWVPTTGFGESVADFVALLRDQGATVVVALVNGITPEVELPGLQHTGVDVAAYLSLNHTGRPVTQKVGALHLITKSFASQPLVDWIQLEFSESHQLVRVSCNATHATDVPEAWKDDAFNEDVAFLQDIIDVVDDGDVVIGESVIPVENGFWNDKCRQEDCELGVIVNSALLASRPGVEIALSNGGAMRGGWPAGTLKKSHLANALPFQNHLCYLNLTGAEIYRALEHSCSTLLANGTTDRGTPMTGQFLQVLGMRYFINPRLLAYHRVTAIHVKETGTGRWVPMDFKRAYSVVTNNFLCGGGDRYAFRPHNNVMETSSAVLKAILMQYIKDTSPVEPRVRGNIVLDFGGATLDTVKTADMCSAEQLFLAEWEVCEECAPGERPEHGVCVLVPPGADHTTLIVGVALASVVLLAVPLVVYLVVARRRREWRVRHAPRDAEANFAVVFTDIKRSTNLWATHQRDMAVALTQHHRICRELIDVHSGYEVKTIGDAFMVAFASPVDAVAFMLDLQMELLQVEWPEGLLSHPACRRVPGLFNGLRVRVGAHYGRASVVETPGGGYDYDGTTCNLAARVGDAGDGGQNVVTEELYRAVEPQLDLLECMPDVSFLGSYIFRDVPGEVACYQLLPAVLAARPFNDLRNVQPPPCAPDDAKSGDHGKVSKMHLTRAMQSLRIWATRDHQGVNFHVLNDLFVAAASDNTPLLGAASRALLNSLASREGTTDDLRTAPSLRCCSTSGSTSSPCHDLSSDSEFGPSSTLLRWPLVSEILCSLPENFILLLEAQVAMVSPCARTEQWL